MENAIGEVVRNNPLAATTGSVTATAAVLYLCHKIYQKATQPRPLSGDEITRYRDMCQLYAARTGSKPIPVFWELDNRQAPTCQVKHEYISTNLTAAIGQMRIRPASIQTIASGMMSSIGQLFKSLSHRTIGKIPDSGIEAMFFTEITYWVEATLPSLGNFTTKSAVEELKRMSEYCRAAGKRLVIKTSPRGSTDDKRNNPSAVLDQITAEIDLMIKITEARIENANFSTLLDNYRHECSQIPVQLIHILYTLIRGSSEVESVFPVALLQEPETDLAHREKLVALRRTQLCQWLLSTLSLVGIADNSYFVANSIDFRQIAAHLENQSCGDDGKFSKPKDDSWGHWPTVVKGETIDDVNARLQAIRQLHRAILCLFNVKKILDDYSSVGLNHGESWMCADNAGKTGLNVLLERMASLLEGLKAPIATITKNKQNLEKPVQDRLDTWVLCLEESIKKLSDFKRNLVSYQNDYHAHLKNITATKIQVFHNILAMMRHFNEQHSEKYRTIEASLLALEDEKSRADKAIIEEAKQIIQQYSGGGSAVAALSLSCIQNSLGKIQQASSEVVIAADSLPCFMRARSLLDTTRLKHALSCDETHGLVFNTELPPNTINYISEVEHFAVREFLQRYHALIERADFWAFPWIAISKMPEFRNLYMRMLALIKWMYAANSPRAGSYVQQVLDHQLVGDLLLKALQYVREHFYADPTFVSCTYQIRGALLSYRVAREGVTISGSGVLMPFANSTLISAFQMLEADLVRTREQLSLAHGCVAGQSETIEAGQSGFSQREGILHDTTRHTQNATGQATNSRGQAQSEQTTMREGSQSSNGGFWQRSGGAPQGNPGNNFFANSASANNRSSQHGAAAAAAASSSSYGTKR